jgi:seryl-tRNA synthetase
VRKNQDPCQRWRNEIEGLNQAINELKRDIEEALAKGSEPRTGTREDVWQRQERLQRELGHAQRQLEKCEDETRSVSETL